MKKPFDFENFDWNQESPKEEIKWRSVVPILLLWFFGKVLLFFLILLLIRLFN